MLRKTMIGMAAAAVASLCAPGTASADDGYGWAGPHGSYSYGYGWHWGQWRRPGRFYSGDGYVYPGASHYYRPGYTILRDYVPGYGYDEGYGPPYSDGGAPYGDGEPGFGYGDRPGYGYGCRYDCDR